MDIYKLKDYDSMSRKAAGIIAAQVVLKPCCVLGLATGSTPLGAYKQLIEWHKAGGLDFSRAKTVNLDEYAGLASEHEQSYRYFMQRNLFEHINIRPENTHLPNGMAQDSTAECARYDAVIDGCGGIDLQLLGMGHNGHVGFNEPGAAFELATHKVTLSQSTIDANKRFFADEKDVPRFALTMGIQSILRARKILVVVSGTDKAAIVSKALRGPVTPEVPASILQLHPDVVLVGDDAALSML